MYCTHAFALAFIIRVHTVLLDCNFMENVNSNSIEYSVIDFPHFVNFNNFENSIEFYRILKKAYIILKKCHYNSNLPIHAIVFLLVNSIELYGIP